MSQRNANLSRCVSAIVIVLGIVFVFNSIKESSYYETLQEDPESRTSTITQVVHLYNAKEEPLQYSRSFSDFVPSWDLECGTSNVELANMTKRSTVEKALDTRAKIAGFHNKSGILSPIQWRPEFTEKRNVDVSVWFAQPRKERSGCSRAQPPYQFPGCTVLINHHYKYIWIKGKRVGGTTIREPLGWICNDGWRVPPNADKSYCSKSLSEDQEVSLTDVEKYWDEYFVFSFIRNPYARFASTFTFVDGLMGGCPRLVDFGKLCDSPFLLTKLCTLLGCCWAGAIKHHMHHAMEQNSCLFTEDGQVAVDFIGETESLESDLRIIIAEINKRKPSNLPDLDIHEDFLPKINSQGDHYIVDLFLGNATCLSHIEENYLADFRRLGYNRITDSL